MMGSTMRAGAVHDVQRRMEAVLGHLALGDVRRVFVRHPAGVHGVHVDAVGVVIRRGGAGHHVQRGLGPCSCADAEWS